MADLHTPRVPCWEVWTLLRFSRPTLLDTPPLLQAADAHKGRKQSAWNTHLHGLLSLTKPKAADANVSAAEEKQPDNEKPVRDYIIKNFVAEEGA